MRSILTQLEAMEDVRVQVLLHSIPCVFRRAGTPDDMEFILGCIRNAICERAVSKELQRLLLEAIGPLCKFSVGAFSVEELRSSIFNLVHEFGHHKHFVPAAAMRPKVHNLTSYRTCGVLRIRQRNDDRASGCAALTCMHCYSLSIN